MMHIKTAILFTPVILTLVWAGTKPGAEPGSRYPAPLSQWEVAEGIRLEGDIMAEVEERILGGHGSFNDYILLRFNMPEDCTDLELSEARRVLLDEIRERMEN